MDRISEISYAKRVGNEEGRKIRDIEILKKLIEMGKDHKEIMEIMDIPKEEEHIIKEMEEKLKANIENQNETEQ